MGRDQTLSQETIQAIHPSVKIETWVRTVEVRMRRKGQGPSKEDQAGIVAKR